MKKILNLCITNTSLDSETFSGFSVDLISPLQNSFCKRITVLEVLLNFGADDMELCKVFRIFQILQIILTTCYFYISLRAFHKMVLL